MRYRGFVMAAMAATAAVLMAVSSGFAATLAPVVNSSFELGTFTDAGGGYAMLNPGATDISGWTVINHTIAWAEVPNVDGIDSYDGTHFLDLSGPGAGVPGGLTQNIATIPGQEYSFTVAILTIDQIPTTVEVDAGSSSGQYTTTNINTWEPHTLNFTADASVTALTIQGISGDVLIGVDATPVQSVPEPSTLALFVLAPLMARSLRRRR